MTNGRSVIVGDLHWVQLPAANGHEQQSRRPAVILQDDQYAGGLPVMLVVPLTTARAAMRFAGTVPILPTAANG
jgi:mRNA interferase MazF